jgi:hypothetical protein
MKSHRSLEQAPELLELPAGRSIARSRSNRSINTDVLSAGFARLLSTSHLQRWASQARSYRG